MPIKIDMPRSDTDRAMASDPDESWPDSIEIVATKGKKKQSITITKDHYFGNSPFGAPISGPWIIFQIEQLRQRLTRDKS